jgi:hypothetical protein
VADASIVVVGVDADFVVGVVVVVVVVVACK